MKRHPHLIPLSHEHHRALHLALQLQKEPDKADTETLLTQEIPVLLAHFAAEETLIAQLLTPFVNQDLLQQFTAEHAQLRQMLQLPVARESYGELGRLLHDHVRFEERVLFPALETHGLTRQGE